MRLTAVFNALLLGSACSDVALTFAREGSGAVSARTMDWGSDLRSEVSAIHSGTRLWLHPVLQESSTGNSTKVFTTEAGFVAARLKALGDVIADGLNVHGFGIGVLWLEHPALLAGIPGM